MPKDNKLSIPLRVEVFKPVPEDWHGNFKIENDQRFKDTKLVKISHLRLSDGTWRVCVWGNDDCGMERDFSGGDDISNEFQSRELFKILCLKPHLTKKILKDLGLIRA